MGSNFFQGVALASVGVRINDDRGKPLNLPINETPPSGIHRTFLNSNDPSNVMVNVSNNNENSPLGFTPPEAYYIQGSASINQLTGLPTEVGNLSVPNPDSLIGKTTRTFMNWTPGNASPLASPDGSIIEHGNNFRMTTYGGEEGFTDPFKYVTDWSNANTKPGLTGVPKQFGDNPTNLVPNWNNKGMVYNDGIKFSSSKIIFDDFNNRSQFNFLHHLDNPLLNGTGQVRGDITQGILNDGSTKDIYLASFKQTSDENEDPVIFGYDITIKFDSSPLFNGSIIDFIDQFGKSDDEIEARRNIWITFCNQFFKFFDIDAKSKLPYDLSNYNSTNNPANATSDVSKQQGTSDAIRNTPGSTSVNTGLPDVTVTGYINSTKAEKAYYLKKLSGLDKLVESGVSSNSDTVKSMIDYGKDLIKLTLHEDVSVNMGYLSMLYKTLSWSRLNGKQIIPENLLRFDAVISITEIRDYEKVIKRDDTKFHLFADKLSKYTYTLYDCQFMFDTLSHGDEIDMSATKTIDSHDMSFNYKYSTVVFDKFSYFGNNTQKYMLDNSAVQPTSISPIKANTTNVSNNTIENKLSRTSLNQYIWPPVGLTATSSDNVIDYLHNNSIQREVNSYSQTWYDYLNTQNNPSALDKANNAHTNNSILGALGRKLTSAVVREVNRQITTQARLLNNTLDNIRNSIGLGRMSAPTNVYYGNSPFRNDVVNAARDFVGQSVRSFFEPVTPDATTFQGPRGS
jgi:hypothetical protein